jgi:hypothetical protein
LTVWPSFVSIPRYFFVGLGRVGTLLFFLAAFPIWIPFHWRFTKIVLASETGCDQFFYQLKKTVGLLIKFQILKTAEIQWFSIGKLAVFFCLSIGLLTIVVAGWKIMKKGKVIKNKKLACSILIIYINMWHKSIIYTMHSK